MIAVVIVSSFVNGGVPLFDLHQAIDVPEFWTRFSRGLSRGTVRSRPPGVRIVSDRTNRQVSLIANDYESKN